MRTLLLRSLFARPVTVAAPSPEADALAEVGRALEERVRRLYGRSLTIREVDAGSCNGCELEIHALNNAVYDCERFGLKFAASPRHCDVLMVTGPVARNMKVALERTYAAKSGFSQSKWGKSFSQRNFESINSALRGFTKKARLIPLPKSWA